MFESLTEKLQETFQRLSRKGRLSNDDVNEGLREVRLALLEADVSYRVVRDFIKRVSERAIGAVVAKSLTPAQTVVKIVHEELISLLGEAERLDLGGQPPVILMLVGLQGSGKTTMAAKLALHLRKNGETPLLVAADTYRPAAITQLQTLGKQISVPVYSEGNNVSPVTICENAVRLARNDTALRWSHLDTARPS
jgi:signal recognition particle subunit SRP54